MTSFICASVLGRVVERTGTIMTSMDSKERLSLKLFILMSSLLLVKAQSKQHDVYSLENFYEALESEKFFHMAVRTNGEVYISSQQSLYRLSDSFALIRNVTCVLENCVNINKVLLIDDENNRLITCGAGNNGRCESRSLDELTYNPGDSAQKVVSLGDLSSIGYIAKNGDTNYFYVAATDNGESNSFNTISIRSLNDFAVVKENFVRVSDEYKTEDSIKYVSGFSYKKFRYFVANINEMVPGTRKSFPRISRVCEDSVSHLSDVYLKCVSGSTSYQTIKAVSLGVAGPHLAASLGINPGDDVLYAVFTLSSTSLNSTLCIYKLSDLETAFEDALYGCLTSQANTKGNYELVYAVNKYCPGEVNLERNTISNQFCQDGTTWTYSQGTREKAASSNAVLELASHNLTAITTTIERNHTIAFLGTAGGHLLKVHIVDNTTARMYEDVVLTEGKMVRSDMVVKNRTLLALTEKQLFKLLIENCGQYMTCEECIGPYAEEDGDPYCGWCTLDRKCTNHDACSSGSWLPYNEEQCISIVEIYPPNLPRSYDVTTTLDIQVQNLPPLTNRNAYQCIFDGTNVIRNALLTNQTLSCDSPRSDMLPPIPEGSDHVSVTISIRSNLTGVKFVETSYDFFSCNAHSGCSVCVDSRWGCDWCVMMNTCTINPKDCLDETIVIHGENVTAKAQCPQIVSGQSHQLHVGVKDKFTIKTINIPVMQISTFKCNVDINNNVQEINAKRDGDIITCQDKCFDYYDYELQDVTAKVTVSWVFKDVAVAIDNEYNVMLYNCSVLRPDCSRCLSNITATPSLNCVWCGANTQCTVAGQCQTLAKECPAPKITKITPSCVATVDSMYNLTTVDHVTIEGMDIGQEVTDIVSVLIGDKSSKIIADNYKVGRSVTVYAPAFAASGNKSVVIVVKGSNGQNKTSELFILTYQNPQVSSFSPMKGPLSGGVNVTIIGKLFNTGSQQQVMIGQSVCNKRSINNTVILCETTESNSTSSNDVIVEFFNAKRKSDAKFQYKPDPIVARVFPSSTIRSGGRLLTVEGEDFGSIQNPKVIVNWNGKMFEEECKSGFNETKMFCPTPELSPINQRVKRQSAAEDKSGVLGFKFANVQDLLAWSNNTGVNTFSIFPDPVYYRFNNTEKYESDVIDGGVFDLQDDIVQLRGEDLNEASTKKDVLVYVGDKLCEVTILSTDQLQCIAPKNVHKTDRFGISTKDYPLVTVIHGNIEVVIGAIKYPEISWWLYAVLAAAAVFMLVILLLTIFFFYCKTKKIEKDKERVLEEMELLEESVREDSRRAIAELTTNLDDLTTELEGTGMPFLTMLDYMKKMMFTGYEKVPADHGSDMKERYNEHGLREFAKLLGKRDFLISFIKMVEENKKISVKEKGNFASLLTVGMVSERKLPYFTEVLTELLEAYISDGVACKRAKQLFRRTESVSEKLLSNWTALCMYDHLKDHAGYPLYLLYQAIKCKVWKGPVDFVTCKSYHSLSIDFLFKDNVDFQEIKLNVAMDNSDAEAISVSVLSCDCITQVKEKILDAMYKSRPYSSRPSASSVDLDLRAGNHGHLVLSDIDNLSRVTGHWRQLNTLDCLQIKDGATVSLVHRANGRHSATVGQIVTNTNPLYENTVNMDAKFGLCDFNLEDGVQPWHLGKESDHFEDDRNSRRKNKSASLYRRKLKTIHEVHFPRLMSTKTTIQKYVDRMFEAILKAPSDDSNLSVPVTIKYLFDFFDKQAEENDAGHIVAKTWKNNSLGQRFWVTVITHPNFIFDILQTLPVEAALKIIAETLIDSCSVEAITYTKDTSTNRLLYTREVQKYREYVDKFYGSIQNMPTAAKNYLNEELECVNENFLNQFSHLSTLQHLYSYAEWDRLALMDVLDQEMHLDMKEQFQQVELAFQQDKD